jgi:hypothetical protein
VPHPRARGRGRRAHPSRSRVHRTRRPAHAHRAQRRQLPGETSTTANRSIVIVPRST